MAICNVFNTLTKKTGTFLTFSQYLEDLSKWNTESSYHRIVPSKFIALELPDGDNDSLPQILQNEFENGCAVYRSELGSEWNAKYSANLFWNTMLNMLGSTSTSTNEVNRRIKYVGDINLQSYNEHAGMGYSEIYCHIPNDALQYRYTYQINPKNYSNNISKPANTIIEGYQEGELGGWEKLSHNTTYNINNEYVFSWDDKSLLTGKIESDSYQVNAIIVLYDVYNHDERIYQSIPLGLYVTGLYDENGVMQNSITKYVCNEDIYNSGTAYGLRICSRYVATPHTDNYIVKDVEVDNGGYSDTSRVLSKIAESQSKMDEVVSKAYSCYQQHKDTLAIFKNNRTNVPYIKIINGESYWFVNGRVINQSTDDAGCNSYTMDELRNLMGIGQGLLVNLNIVNKIKEKQDIPGSGTLPPTQVTLNWDVTYEGKNIIPDKVEIIMIGEDDNDRTTLNVTHTNSATIDIATNTNTRFEVRVEYRNMIASTSSNVVFVEPTYFGLVEFNNMCDSNDSNDSTPYAYNCSFVPTLNQIKSLHKIPIDWSSQNPFDILNEYIKTNKITTTSDHQHICLLYPYSYLDINGNDQISREVCSITDEHGYVFYIKLPDSEGGYINDYDKLLINVDNGNIVEGMSDSSNLYNLYISKAHVSLENYVLKFK